MNIVIVGTGTNRARVQMLMAAIAESGIHIVESGEPIEFRADKYDVKNLEVLRAKDFVIDKPNRPEFKRGKGKVKRWP